MNRIEKAKKIQMILDDLYPKTPIPLDHSSAYTLLVAMLSAQTTDKKLMRLLLNYLTMQTTQKK